MLVKNDILFLLMVLNAMPSLQIDALVAQALDKKQPDRKGSREIESFTNLLSDMRLSMKV